MPDPFYSTPEWRRLRNRVKQKWFKNRLACFYCGEPFMKGDKTIVDHRLNRKKHPEMAMVESNLVVVHHACNTRKYHKVESRDIPETGEDGFPINSDWST